jgi:hypothetical protein
MADYRERMFPSSSSIFFNLFHLVFLPSPFAFSSLRIQSIIKTEKLVLQVSRAPLVFPKHYHYWIVRVSSPASRFVINSRVENEKTRIASGELHPIGAN